MLLRTSAALILICGFANACAHEFAGAKRITVIGTVVARVNRLTNVGVVDDQHCEDRLLLRVTERRGAFQPGEYLVLQYEVIRQREVRDMEMQLDAQPLPCELPRDMFDGQSVWKFTASKDAAGQGPLRKMLPVWESPGTDEERTVDTPEGRITIVRFANLTMLDGGRIEDLPLDSTVQEFRLAAHSFQRLR